jgi:hypothetical protein
MNFDSKTAAGYAADKLDSLLERAHRDTLTLVERGDIPAIVTHFDCLRSNYRKLKEKLNAIEAEVNDLSYTIIPNIFNSQQVKTINIEGVGRVTVAVQWKASMRDKAMGMDWLRQNGHGSLIIETVNAQTLASFAKSQALDGKPLSDDLFEVGTANYTSVTKV